MSKQKILLVEDEEGIREFVTVILETNGYETISAKNGNQALAAIIDNQPDVVLLDLGLPDMDGLTVLKTARELSAVPIIIVSSRIHEKEKVIALDAGADDYITKPFGTEELLARIRTVLRHVKQHTEGVHEVHVFQVGDLVIDYDKRIVSLKGKEIHFTPIEYKLLVALSKQAGRVLTYDYLMKLIWGPYVDERQALRVNMANIRKKIEVDKTAITYIKTEVGIGYRMMDAAITQEIE